MLYLSPPSPLLYVKAFYEQPTKPNTLLPPIDKVIILEEDLDIAPDFFNYFGSLSRLLDDDTNLLTISAWNDNGMANRVHDPAKLYR